MPPLRSRAKTSHSKVVGQSPTRVVAFVSQTPVDRSQEDLLVWPLLLLFFFTGSLGTRLPAFLCIFQSWFCGDFQTTERNEEKGEESAGEKEEVRMLEQVGEGESDVEEDVEHGGETA